MKTKLVNKDIRENCKSKMTEINDRLFAFKTLEDAIEVADNHVINCLCWWTENRSHNNQTRHVWHSWLQCAEDFSQLGKWLKRLKKLEAEHEQIYEIIKKKKSDKEKVDEIFRIMLGVERDECELN